MMNTLNPDDFIISRKRKRYKFALFANSPLCFEFEEWIAQRPRLSDIGVTVEVGAGNGFFSVELASRYPDQTFVALDVKGDRLQRGARRAEEQGLTNVLFVRARADQLAELFEADSVQAIWLTFPDPFPRSRSAARRMTHGRYLGFYADLLSDFGALHLKHDDRDFFTWSLEQLVASGWHIKELTFDLHESDLSDDYKILTAYEERWLSEGLTTNFVKAVYGDNK